MALYRPWQLLIGLFSLSCPSLFSLVFLYFLLYTGELTLSLVYLVSIELFISLSLFLSYPLFQLPKVWVIILSPLALCLMYFSSAINYFVHYPSLFPFPHRTKSLYQGETHCIQVFGLIWMLSYNYLSCTYG